MHIHQWMLVLGLGVLVSCSTSPEATPTEERIALVEEVLDLKHPFIVEIIGHQRDGGTLGAIVIASTGKAFQFCLEAGRRRPGGLMPTQCIYFEATNGSDPEAEEVTTGGIEELALAALLRLVAGDYLAEYERIPRIAVRNPPETAMKKWNWRYDEIGREARLCASLADRLEARNDLLERGAWQWAHAGP